MIPAEILFSVFFLIVWALSICMTVFGTWMAIRKLSQVPPHLDLPFGLFPVTILKPLKGIDFELSQNLESYYLIDYPEFELIFSVESLNDPAAEIVQRLIQKHPKVRARLMVGVTNVGHNPKVNNLIQSYEAAAFDWILVSDSNTRVKSDYLKRMMAHIDGSTGIVAALVAGRRGLGVGGMLESVYLNTFYARNLVLAEWVGKPCVVGKSMLFKKSEAKRFGGIAMLGRFLAEDFMAGEAMRRLGLKVIMMTEPIPQIIGQHALKQFWSRHVRWGRIRKAHSPVTFFLEPIFGLVISGIFGAYAFSELTQIEFWKFMFFHLMTWSVCDYLLISKLDSKMTLITPLAWFARECLAPILWLATSIGNTVNWRGQRLRILAGGIVEESSHET